MGDYQFGASEVTSEFCGREERLVLDEFRAQRARPDLRQDVVATSATGPSIDGAYQTIEW
jgi:hypothetical protein